MVLLNKLPMPDQYPSLPKITFAIPTYNEAHRIEKCLQAICAQDYSKSLIEIIIVDANSTDATVNIAKTYGAKIIDNPKKLPEPGLALAYKIAQGDYMVFMAADNILYDPQWLSKMIVPFIDNSEDTVLSFSKVVNDPNDNIWNKYINEDQEPFSSFVFENASHPDKFSLTYPIRYKTDDYVVYEYNEVNYPLIALAQGTILKTKLPRMSKDNDDIAPIIEIIKSGKNIAYVLHTGLYHYSYSGFDNVCKKLNFRIKNSIKTRSYNEREKYSNTWRKVRKYIFLVYAVTIVFPIFDGLRLFFKKRKLYMLLHPIAVFLVASLIIKNYITIMLYEKT